MKILLLDFETQSHVSIVNPEYTCHPSTNILCMSYGFKGEKGYLWWPGDELPQEVLEHIESGGLIGASNARFDKEIWAYVGVEDYGLPETSDEQWICTQAQARVAGLPSALDKSARALNLKQRKTSTGRTLIAKCSIIPYSTDPQDYADMASYCLQDWVVMDKVSLSIPDLNDVQVEDYLLNERVNDRGIKIDRELAQAAQNYAEAERAEINEKLKDVSCGAITKCTQYARVGKWVRECLEDDGLHEVIKLMVRYKTDKETKETVKKYSVDKAVRANMLAGHTDSVFELPSDVFELLGLMEDAGGSAVSKFGAMLQKAHPEDDRVRGIMRYAGAPSTLRFSSMGLQVHNFRRDAFSPEYAEFLKAQMIRGEVLKDEDGNVLGVMDTLGRLLRSALIPKEGHVFVVGDWNAIESRMTAWLAGDEDKLDMFRRGEDPYCYAAEGIYGRPIDAEEDPKQRMVGKVTDLALGFLGGTGALSSMATQYKVYIDPEAMPEIVKNYRLKHQKIVAFGDALLKAAHRAVTYPNTHQKVGCVEYFFDADDGALYCQLPGDCNRLRYPECRFEMKAVPWDETEFRPQLTALKAAFTPKVGSKEWARHGLWRGIFLENNAQSICCQLMRECLVECEEENLDVIFHVHDEIILEVPIEQAEAARDKLQEIQEFVSDYLEGLPLVAKPVIMKRYGK